jgi:hypothetical protein
MKYTLSAFPTKITYAKVNYDKALTSERAPMEIFFFKCNEGRLFSTRPDDVLSERADMPPVCFMGQLCFYPNINYNFTPVFQRCDFTPVILKQRIILPLSHYVMLTMLNMM